MTDSPSIGIIALVPDAWQDIVQTRHHVMRRLAGHFPVIWMEPAKNWRESLRIGSPGFLSPDRWAEPVPQLETLTAGWRRPRFDRVSRLASATFRSRLSLARRRLVERGVKKIVLYIWRDEFAEALNLVEHDFSCYHIDDEYSFSNADPPISEREALLLQRVDQVIIHSPALLAKKGGLNPNTTLIPNGVDYRAFSEPQAEPADMAAIPHPRIGYAGVIKKQLDFALLARLARARPACSFVMLGPVLNVSGKERALEELHRLPNVHWISGRPAADLPGYVQHFDVCVMCYEVNDYTRYIFPLKLNEYLATGRPTVSSPIEAMRGFSGVVAVARNDAEWLAAIDDGLAAAACSSEAVEARRAVARNNDWGALVDRIAELIKCRAGAGASHPAALAVSA